MAIVVIRGVRFATVKAGYPQSQTSAVTNTTTTGIVAWLLLTGILSLTGFYRNFTAVPPRLMTAVLPVVVLMLWLLYSRKTQALIKVLPQEWIIGVQAFRILVEVELYLLFIHNLMPQIMTFGGRNFDMLVGLTAVPVALAVAKKRLGRTGIIIWNWAGIIILGVVVANGMLSVPSVMQQIQTDPPNVAMAYVPFVWLPAYLAPLAMFLHGVSLRNLRLNRQSVATG